MKDPELYQLMQNVADRLHPYTAGNYLLSDDKAPVELLGMQVIDSLIQNEVGYYRELYETRGITGLLESLQ